MISQQKLAHLEKHLQDCVSRGVFPGASFSIVTRDNINTLYVGNRQITPNLILNDDSTVWDLASLTKVLVTSTCILKLIELGIITLKTKISSVLNEFEYSDITILHCLTHTSGLESDIPNYKKMTRDEMLNYVNHPRIEFDPDQNVLYSDINFILLGLVIDRLTNGFEKFANKTVFTPLKMTSTGFNPDASQQNLCASYEDIYDRGGIIKGIVHDGKALKFGGISGHAGLFSTIGDLGNFVSMVIHDGVFEGVQVLSPLSINLMKICHTPGLNEHRSIGWIISDPHHSLGDYFSETTLFHTGFSGSSILIDLERKVGFICTSNRIHPSRENLKIIEERNHLHNLAYMCIDL